MKPPKNRRGFIRAAALAILDDSSLSGDEKVQATALLRLLDQHDLSPLITALGSGEHSSEVIECFTAMAETQLRKEFHKFLNQPTAATPAFPHFMLHLLLPRCDRALVERDLDEQFEAEKEDPLLGPRCAKVLYCKRVVENLTIHYGWKRMSKWSRTAIVAIAILKLTQTLGVIIPQVQHIDTLLRLITK